MKLFRNALVALSLLAVATPALAQSGIGPNMDMRVARTVERCGPRVIPGGRLVRITEYNREGIELSYRDTNRVCGGERQQIALRVLPAVPIANNNSYAEFCGRDGTVWTAMWDPYTGRRTDVAIGMQTTERQLCRPA